MNDPGFDKPISNDAKDVENQVGNENKQDEDEEKALLGPR
jgi:potassium channel subfamily K